MIIGFDASRANRKNKTGVEWYTYYLLKHLAKIDSKNLYWLYTDTPLGEELKNLGPNFVEKHLKWPFRYLWTQARLSWEMLRHKPDILFIPASVIPLIHARKTITVIPDIGFIEYPQAYPFFRKLYLDFSVHFAGLFAKKIITVSHASKSSLIEKYGIRDSRISVTYLSHDSEKFHTHHDENAKNHIVKKYHLTKPYIFYIGVISKKKNIEGILKAFERFHSSPVGQSYCLVLAGRSGDYSDAMNSSIEKAGLKDAVILPGWVEPEDLPLFLANASIFIFPSLLEGFGIPILEAFASGIPVICSSRGSLPEVTQGAALLINPQDTQNIYEALKTIVEDTLLRKKLTQRGLEIAKQFSWDTCARETLDIFESFS